MTFGIARMHSLIAYFVDYVRIDQQIDVDGMLENRKQSLAGFRMAGKYLAIIKPFSALLSSALSTACTHTCSPAWICCVNGSHASAWTTSPWPSGPASHCLKALRLIYACFLSHAARTSCTGQTGITNSRNWPTSGHIACLHPHRHSMACRPAALQGCIVPGLTATRPTASDSRPTTASPGHAS